MLAEDMLTPGKSVTVHADVADQERRRRRCRVRPVGGIARTDEVGKGFEDITDVLGLDILSDCQTELDEGDARDEEIADDYELLDDLFRACGEEGSTMDQNKLPAEQNGLAPRGRIGAWIKQKIVGGRKDWMA